MWLGSWFINVCLAQVVVVVLLSVEVALTYPEMPGWGLLLPVFVLTVAIPLWFFPYSRTLWVAVDLIMRPLEFDEGVAPGVELDQLASDGRGGDGVSGV